MKNIQILHDLIAPSVEALGYELWGCFYVPQGRHALLRVYIDNPQGINVDDCEKVSRQISAVLDVENPIKTAYSLEVSSPGLDRPLFHKAHFERFVGARIHLQLHLPINNRRHFNGRLLAVEGDDILVNVDEEELKFTFTNIARANVLPENVLPKKSREKRA